MKLASLSTIPESTTKFVGELPTTLGNKQPFTLHYGGLAGRPSMLFAKYPLTYARSLLKKIATAELVLPTQNGPGHINWKNKAKRNRQIAHVGEAHLTIATDLLQHETKILKRFGAASIEEALIKAGLFDMEGNGKEFKLPSKYAHGGPDVMIGLAKFYSDDKDPAGPYILGLVVESDMTKIRQHLGLSNYPTIPGVTHYIEHITIAFMNTAKNNNIKKQLNPKAHTD